MDIKQILVKWGPQHLAKGVEMGLDELDNIIVGWPVKPSFVGNLAATGLGAIGAFMAPAPYDEILMTYAGHHSTKLWDYLKLPTGVRVASRPSMTYIPSTGELVSTRPGLGESIKYAPEQRVVTAPKFIPGVLRPKYQLGS